MLDEQPSSSSPPTALLLENLSTFPHFRAAKSQSKQGNKPGKNPLDVNTKVKRIDPATVEISVRADPKKKQTFLPFQNGTYLG